MTRYAPRYTLARYHDDTWADEVRKREGYTNARDRFVLRVARHRAPLSEDEWVSALRLWGDLCRASGNAGKMGEPVDAGSGDPAPSFVDRGAAFRRAAAAMGYVLGRLRSPLQKAIFARCFDHSPHRKMAWADVLADLDCHHDTLGKGIRRAAQHLVVHYRRTDDLTGGANKDTDFAKM